MGGWEIFVIPLIAFVIWVLQYIFRGPEENKAPNRPRPQPGQGRPNANRPRRQVTDLDRFLEETRKRKQQDEGRPVVVAEVVSEGKLDRSEALEQERRRASAPSHPVPERPRPQPVPPTPRRPPLPSQPVLVEVAPPPVKIATSDRKEPGSAPRADTVPISEYHKTTRDPRKLSNNPLLAELTKMMRTPRGAAMALILREVLDTPVSQRHRK